MREQHTPEENKMSTYTVYRKGEPTTFESPFADDEAVKLLAGIARPSEFSRSLVNQFNRRGRLSTKQMPWVHFLLVEAMKPEPVPVQPKVSLQGLADLLATAAPKIKWPKVTVTFPEGTIKIARAGARARFPGSVNVTSEGSYGTAKWYGRVMTDGTWSPSPSCPGWVLPALEIFAADPAGVAAGHGHRTGGCCFCSLPLTTEESTTVGYGPVCAKNWGLPWGGK
jgi:hypothetical protein